MEENLVNEIKLHFTSSRQGIRPLKNEDENTFTIKDDLKYGVGVLNPYEIEINEKFSNVSLVNEMHMYNGKLINLLVLSSSLFSHKLEFSYLCAQFASLGKNRENRDLLENKPLEWWLKWQELLGNAISNRSSYSVIAELYIWMKELENRGESEWMGPETASHDIQNTDYNIEVKSTLSKYNNEVKISGQFQLLADSPLFIAFVKMEESKDGVSINSLVQKLVDMGQDLQKINNKLAKLGFEAGSSLRSIKKYRVNELRFYEVDDHFPKIIESSFVDNVFPKGIKKIEYVVDLEGLDYQSWYE